MQQVAEASPDFDISVLASMGEIIDKQELQEMQHQHEQEVATLMNKIKGRVIITSSVIRII